MSTPKLSIVVTARNDNHGGQLLDRMRMFIHSFSQQCDMLAFPVELILVEWNPVEIRKSLLEELEWHPANRYLQARVITVPTSIHRYYNYSDGLPLYQMLAKNVGIRRAIGEFILVTNVDILFSFELMQWLAKTELDKSVQYRIDRFDVDLPVPEKVETTELLAACQSNLLRQHMRDGSLNFKTNDWFTIFPEGKYSLREKLHTNGCGDFALTHRDNWFATRGYPELDLFSFHIDSLWVFQAHFAGIREQLLKPPLAIFHLEHSGGWTPEVEQSGTLYSQLAVKKVARLTTELFNGSAMRMTRTRQTLCWNEDDWGMKDVNLPDTVCVQANWHSSITSTPQIKRPKISLIAVSRNDNHGGALTHRTNLFLDSWRQGFENAIVDAEIIIVDWNPPTNQASLQDELQWIPSEFVSLRLVTVPNELHSSLSNSADIPLFQMIGKNVGLQRARGDWLIATCVDVVPNRELIDFLAHGTLDENAFYRMDRFDSIATIDATSDALNHRVELLESALIRQHTIGKTLQAASGEQIPNHQLHDSNNPDCVITDGANLPLHTNACGDFTMLHRKAWSTLRGYPEVPLWSIFIDGLLLHAAIGAGFHQIVIHDPARLYHIEHDHSWAVTDSPAKAPYRLDYAKEYHPWCQELLQNSGKSINPIVWGWKDIPLPEITL